jgi:Na+/H+ antiporter NhaD/arsenite permease-like protein
LAATSTLAGNATPIASAATLILLELASDRDVVVPLRELLRIGVPLAITTTLVGMGMVLYLTG